MLAFQLDRYDGPSALRLAEVPEPSPDPGRILIDVRAVGINFPDLLATRGVYQHRPGLPFVPGCEIAGDVISAPASSGVGPGDRVAAFTWDSGYAERVLVDPAGAVVLPTAVSYEEGAAMVVNYHTAYFALRRRGGLRSGETVLVMGAAGGIGTAAVQLAGGLGARVIAGVAGEEQAQVALSAGAGESLPLTEGFASEVRDRTGGRGVDVVVDPLGDRFFGEAIRALAPEGRILVIGFAAGEIPTLRINRILLRNASVVGVAWGAFLAVEPNVAASCAKALNELYALGSVRPQIGLKVPFRELPKALSRLARGEIPGKAVAVLTP
jgi:NADPH2:quinone reductase